MGVYRPRHFIQDHNLGTIPFEHRFHETNELVIIF